VATPTFTLVKEILATDTKASAWPHRMRRGPKVIRSGWNDRAWHRPGRRRRAPHAWAVVTLDVYGHMWPDSDDRTRAAVDAYLGAAADSLRTGDGSSQVQGGSTAYPT
jgi:hypothetical protein